MSRFEGARRALETRGARLAAAEARAEESARAILEVNDPRENETLDEEREDPLTCLVAAAPCPVAPEGGSGRALECDGSEDFQRCRALVNDWLIRSQKEICRLIDENHAEVNTNDRKETVPASVTARQGRGPRRQPFPPTRRPPLLTEVRTPLHSSSSLLHSCAGTLSDVALLAPEPSCPVPRPVPPPCPSRRPHRSVSVGTPPSVMRRGIESSQHQNTLTSVAKSSAFFTDHDERATLLWPVVLGVSRAHTGLAALVRTSHCIPRSEPGE
jgi:hypothetical protein